MQAEPGADRVAEAMPNARIGAVNFSEVVAKLVEAGLEETAADSLIDTLQLKVIPFDQEQARLAGLLRVVTRRFGLSLGDRACLALACVHGAVALTCEKSWMNIEAACVVELIR
ncbi:MAG TPA: type II toxin-antitoxin system VapC family toxin [Roseiarcus sp.]|nr:type II toxin-antitoxin system VapC family toxin [Roseiarcus sp.]